MKDFQLSDFHTDVIEAGCDEAGRGSLAGPVFAAAVILPRNFDHPLLNDSKQVCEKNRTILRKYIEEKAIAYAVASCSHEEIDQINILNASILAMHKALELFENKPQHIIVDGNRFNPFLKIPHTCIIKGDTLYKSIAAASILAKTYRDEFMISLHNEYPIYSWNSNKGYPTSLHCEAIGIHGICEFHRKTFHLKDLNQLNLKF